MDWSLTFMTGLRQKKERGPSKAIKNQTVKTIANPPYIIVVSDHTPYLY
jgi:hypothetical protein